MRLVVTDMMLYAAVCHSLHVPVTLSDGHRSVLRDLGGASTALARLRLVVHQCASVCIGVVSYGCCRCRTRCIASPPEEPGSGMCVRRFKRLMYGSSCWCALSLLSQTLRYSFRIEPLTTH